MQTIEWPFLATEALKAGAMTFRELRRFHEGVYPGVWIPRGVDLTPEQRAKAAWLWSGRSGVIAGLSAAAMLGSKFVEANMPAQLIYSNRRPPSTLIVHSDSLLPGEVRRVSGLPVTTAARTAFDLGRRLSCDDGVERIDALMRKTKVTVADIEAVAAKHRGERGVRQLRETLALVDGGAESLYESRVRLILVRADLPRPETRIKFYDEYGEVRIRVDMGWREWKVAVEYDGRQHWDDAEQRAWDIERLAILESLGWVVIRVSSAMLWRPERIVGRTRDALIARGWKPSC